MAKLSLSNGAHEVARAVRVEGEHLRELVLRSDGVVLARDKFLGPDGPHLSGPWLSLGRLRASLSVADWIAAKRAAGWAVREVLSEGR